MLKLYKKIVSYLWNCFDSLSKMRIFATPWIRCIVDSMFLFWIERRLRCWKISRLIIGQPYLYCFLHFSLFHYSNVFRQSTKNYE